MLKYDFFQIVAFDAIHALDSGGVVFGNLIAFQCIYACPVHMNKISGKRLVMLILLAATALLAAIHQVVVGNVNLIAAVAPAQILPFALWVVMYPSSTVQRPNRWPLSGFIAAFIPFMLRIYSSSQEKSPSFKSVQ